MVIKSLDYIFQDIIAAMQEVLGVDIEKMDTCLILPPPLSKLERLWRKQRRRAERERWCVRLKYLEFLYIIRQYKPCEKARSDIMRHKHVKTLLLYYRGIPEMLKLLKQEQGSATSASEPRQQEISVKIQVLEMDAAMFRDCIDCLSGRYKRIVKMRYLGRHSWAWISARVGAPESTVRGWHEKAIDRLSEAFEEIPMQNEILDRASRARE